MAKRRLKPKVEGREPNSLCPCHSGLKYKKCHGKGMKGVGKYPRESARRNLKMTNEEIQKSSLDIVRFATMQRMMAERRAGRIQ